MASYSHKSDRVCCRESMKGVSVLEHNSKVLTTKCTLAVRIYMHTYIYMGRLLVTFESNSNVKFCSAYPHFSIR